MSSELYSLITNEFEHTHVLHGKQKRNVYKRRKSKMAIGTPIGK